MFAPAVGRLDVLRGIRVISRRNWSVVQTIRRRCISSNAERGSTAGTPDNISDEAFESSKPPLHLKADT